MFLLPPPRKMTRSLNTQLAAATRKLMELPLFSSEELLCFLYQVGNTLTTIDHSPTKSTRVSVSNLSEALVADELLWHSDIDVRVAVAYCLSQITRITEPNHPFHDEKIKDVFRLIVSTFDNLSDRSSNSYIKRVLTLETVARVDFCIRMVDFECDDLITEMFQIFFSSIRDYHADVTFLSMKKIMIRILEESCDVSSKLLTPLLSSMQNDNEQVSLVARRLGETVFQNCAVKLKPYVREAIKSMNTSLDNYSEIVSSVCGGTIEHQTDHASAEQLVAKDVEGTCLDNTLVSENSPKRDGQSHEKARLVEEQVPSECQHSSGKRKVSGTEKGRRNLVGSTDEIWLSKDQLHEDVAISSDPSLKKHKIFLEADEADPTSTATLSIMLDERDVDVHAEDSSLEGSVGKYECRRKSPKQMHSSAPLLGERDKLGSLEAHLVGEDSLSLVPEDEQNGSLQSTKMNMEKVQSTLERMQSFSIATVTPTDSAEITNLPSPMILAEQIWTDFMTYPDKVFGSPDNERTTMEALSLLLENPSLFGDEEGKLLLEAAHDILSSILRARMNKKHLQQRSRQLKLELEECGNDVNKSRESVGAKIIKYDDLGSQEQDLVMQKRELERQLQEVEAKMKIIGVERNLTGEKVEEESLEAETIMSMAREKQARSRSIVEEEANEDSQIFKFMSRFFAFRSAKISLIYPKVDFVATN